MNKPMSEDPDFAFALQVLRAEQTETAKANEEQLP